ncbi:DegT/DnrJ/EryC1/StrS family aminotransferase [Micromonospora yangpuensis]|uniref:dTDP-4-amino-4,6-dideoxygalactose transaminase n=1 Tax=Micromonospora yangpuensis TaxID=683228 RepID=A0A1C6UGH8_9ACTN|nr:DegT/DnrJ/EryC1/StrS aminotransferase family protein [Micromonospora yangpuensis]GGM04633.1 spore coat protein [Micromonospora yangpuensis]SCL53205.1 dTDP-4-amino-4,6-dideoxygalactose transaminase [Micromonospora yangpuensis]
MGDRTLPFALPDLGEAEIRAVNEAIRSGWVSSGPLVREFEQRFAERCGPGVTAVALNSATAGLHLALEALSLPRGAEVLVPTWTFTATAEVVVHVGAIPVFVDVDPVTLNIDLADVTRKVTARTAAVMPVHFAGQPVAAEALRTFARDHGLAVVEDAAHAFPAASAGVPVGGGDSAATVFSFYATKTITTGEGGMLVTRDPALAQRVRTMRLHGFDRDGFDRYRSTLPAWQYNVVEAGFKYNLTDPAAAMGLVQLDRAEAMRLRRAEIAARYRQAFTGLPIDLPQPAPETDLHSWHLFVVRLRPEAPVGRDGFIAELARLGVGCGVHFIPLHRHTYWQQRYALTDEMFPVASAEFPRVVSLPIFSAMDDAQVELVIRTVSKVLQ